MEEANCDNESKRSLEVGGALEGGDAKLGAPGYSEAAACATQRGT